MSYVYIETENWTDGDGNKNHLYTVGFYKPDGKFESDGDHSNRKLAAMRVAYLNGGAPFPVWESLKEACDCFLRSRA